MRIKELLTDKAILAIQDGNHGEKHPTSADYVDEGIPFIMARDFHDGQVDLINSVKIPKALSDKLRIGFARSGDVLLTHKGTVGMVAIVPNIKDYVMLTPQVTYYRVDPSKLSGSYLKYAFQAPLFRSQLKSFSAQSTRPYLGITAQKELQIDIPLLPEQQRIAAILSAYDELIENNQRRIKILETMTSSLYREWFVHFRFPGHEAVPLVPSPLGPIPKGWNVVHVKDIISRLATSKTYRGNEVKPSGYVPVVDQSSDELLGYHNNQPDCLATTDSPVAIFGDHTCKMRLLIEPFSIGPNVVPFVARSDYPTTYIYYAVNSLVKTQEYKRHWTMLNSNEIIISDKSTAHRFARITEANLSQRAKLAKINQNLRQTRDLLLPRLMEGKIDV